MTTAVVSEEGRPIPGTEKESLTDTLILSVELISETELINPFVGLDLINRGRLEVADRGAVAIRHSKMLMRAITLFYQYRIPGLGNINCHQSNLRVTLLLSSHRCLPP